MKSLAQHLKTNWLKLAVILFLALPAFVASRSGSGENRQLASLPDFPASWARALEAPRQLDAWVNDHFGFRYYLVRLDARARYALFRDFTSKQVIEGPNGRVYVSSHDKSFPPYSAITRVCSFTDNAPDHAIYYVNQMFIDFQQRGMHPQLLIAPSSPVIEYRDLPPWLRQRCAGTDTPVNRVLQSPKLDEEARKAIFYPLAEMRAINSQTDLFPKTWFHWSGPGLASIVDLSVEKITKQKAPKVSALPTREFTMGSDVPSMLAGVPLPSEVLKPDFASSGIAACSGPSCFPELGTAAAKIADLSRFGNPSAPIKRRLLLLSDSFGAGIAGYYARDYATVEHIAGNNLTRLDDEENRRLQQLIFRDPATTDVIVLFHDGGAIYDTLEDDLARLVEPASQAPALDAAQYRPLAQEIYLALLGRAADPKGLDNLSALLAVARVPPDMEEFAAAYVKNRKVRHIVDSFSNSAEARRANVENTAAFVSTAYAKMFGRKPAFDELSHWVNAIDKDKLNRGQAKLLIMAQAVGKKTAQNEADADLVSKKISSST
ncbi:MAG TPA: DUF4214 domain-containing protein [Burkholderiaceae bacterium]